MKYKARGKMKAELSVWGWLYPIVVLVSILALGCVSFSLPGNPLACFSPKLILAPWAYEQRWPGCWGLTQLLLLGWHDKVRRYKPFGLQTHKGGGE